MPDTVYSTLSSALAGTAAYLGTPPGCESPTVALVHDDSVAVMDRMPAGSADVVFADPPYLLSRGGSTVSGGRRVAVDKGAWDRPRGGVDAEHQWTRRWLRSAQRLLKHSGTAWVCGNYQSIWSVGWAMQSMGWALINGVMWCKPNAAPNIGCRQLTYSWEAMLWASPRPLEPLPHVFNDAVAREFNDGKQLRDFWVMPASVPVTERGGGPKHPTQKPEAVVARALAISLPPGGVVVDPFMGSGTAGAAALNRAGLYVGIDADRQWVDVAARRLGLVA